MNVTGWVPETVPYLHASVVSIAPLRYGAGVKGKIGEALSYGLPVVTTNVGAEGMGLRDGEEALITDSPHDFAAAVVRAYRDEGLWRRLSDSGRAHVGRHFSPEAVGKVINDSVRGLFEQGGVAQPQSAKAPKGRDEIARGNAPGYEPSIK